jgi:hypothetical protein
VDAAALAVSLAALVVSALAIRWAREGARAQHRLAEIEHERRQDELRHRNQANLHARFERTGKSMRFIVENLGDATARDVTPTIAPAPGLQGEAPRLNEVPFPATIDPGGQISALSIPFAGMAFACHVTLTWLDDAGNHRERTLHVSTPPKP